METTTSHKAIAAFITAAAGMVTTLFAVNLEWLSAELVGVVATVAVAGMTWLVPNKTVE